MSGFEEENKKLKFRVSTLQKKLDLKYHRYLIDAKEIKLKKKLGDGLFGEVFDAKWKGSGGGVKVVCQKFAVGENRKMEEVFEELDIATGLNHPLVIRYYGYCKYSQDEVLLVMEKTDMHSLKYTLANRLSMYERFKLIHNMARAVHHLHSREILHRNLKSIHFLMSKDGHTFKISEFAYGKKGIGSYDTVEEEAKGSIHWLAPEILRGNASYSFKSDIYSLGMCFYEIIYGDVPFSDKIAKNTLSEKELIKQIREGMQVDLEATPAATDEAVPQEFKDLIVWLTKKDPRERPLTGEVLKWFRKQSSSIRKKYSKKN